MQQAASAGSDDGQISGMGQQACSSMSQAGMKNQAAEFLADAILIKE
jgi:hypothetical protein